MSKENISKESTDFLLNLLLEENQYINVFEYMDKSDPSINNACACISLGICESYEFIKNNFMDSDALIAKYIEVYSAALENYKSIVGTNIRQTFIDEVKIFYSLDLKTNTLKNLISIDANKSSFMTYLDSIKDENKYAMILRDEITLAVIHYDADNYIVIDPHIEYSGILSKNGIYKYITYDGIWDFDVTIMIPNK